MLGPRLAARGPHTPSSPTLPVESVQLQVKVAPVAVASRGTWGVWAGHGPRARRRENQVFSVHHKLGMMIYNRHARELATKGRALRQSQ